MQDRGTGRTRGGDGCWDRTVEGRLTDHRCPAAHPLPGTGSPGTRSRDAIDIRYTNADRAGFFAWLTRHRIPCQHVFVECKNYTGDPANPELDQLSGRFSPLRGQVGLMVCRTLTDKELFLARCRDTALDQRGFCLALDDDDLTQLVSDARTARETGRSAATDFPLLKACYDRLIT